jgi:hypothetical protein
MEKTKRFPLSGVLIVSLSFFPQTFKKIYRPQNQMSRTKMIILDLLPQKRRLIEMRFDKHSEFRRAEKVDEGMA